MGFGAVWGVKVDDRQIRETIAILGSHRAKRAFSRGINRAATRGATLYNRAIREQVNLKAGRVRKDIRVRKSSPQHLAATIRIGDRPVLLRQFGMRVQYHRPKTPGAARGRLKRVTVKIKRGGRRTPVKGGFPIRLKRGDEAKAGAVSVAKFKKGRLTVLHGPSPYQVAKQDTSDRLNPKLNDLLAKEIDRAVTSLIGR